jgi:hypothetical protein
VLCMRLSMAAADAVITTLTTLMHVPSWTCWPLALLPTPALLPPALQASTAGTTSRLGRVASCSSSCCQKWSRCCRWACLPHSIHVTMSRWSVPMHACWSVPVPVPLMSAMSPDSCACSIGGCCWLGAAALRLASLVVPLHVRRCSGQWPSPVARPCPRWRSTGACARVPSPYQVSALHDAAHGTCMHSSCCQRLLAKQARQRLLQPAARASAWATLQSHTCGHAAAWRQPSAPCPSTPRCQGLGPGPGEPGRAGLAPLCWRAG